MNNMELFQSEKRSILVATTSDLEAAIRNVISDFLSERDEIIADAKVSRAVTAKRLHKTPMTLFRWERAGKLHPIRIGRSIYYLDSEVKLLENGLK